MANNTSRNPWKIDTKAVAVYARDAAATVGNANTLSTKHRIFVDHFAIHTGDGTTDIEILDAASGLRLALVKAPVASDDIWYDCRKRVDGIYVTTAPDNFTIEVFVGDPDA